MFPLFAFVVTACSVHLFVYLFNSFRVMFAEQFGKECLFVKLYITEVSVLMSVYLQL